MTQPAPQPSAIRWRYHGYVAVLTDGREIALTAAAVLRWLDAEQSETTEGRESE